MLRQTAIDAIDKEIRQVQESISKLQERKTKLEKMQIPSLETIDTTIYYRLPPGGYGYFGTDPIYKYTGVVPKVLMQYKIDYIMGVVSCEECPDLVYSDELLEYIERISQNGTRVTGQRPNCLLSITNM